MLCNVAYSCCTANFGECCRQSRVNSDGVHSLHTTASMCQLARNSEHSPCGNVHMKCSWGESLYMICIKLLVYIAYSGTLWRRALTLLTAGMLAKQDRKSLMGGKIILAFAAVIIIYISSRWVMAVGWNRGCFNVQASRTLGQILQHQVCKNRPHLLEVQTLMAISISALLSLSGL